MTDFPILKSLGYILFTAAAAVLLLRTLRVPAIVAYMAAGLLLGPVLGVLELTEGIELISETGIVLLLFLVGLELSLDNIRGVGRVALLGGGVQIGVSAAVGFGTALLFGHSTAAAAILALAVTFSSTVVVVKLLGQRRELRALHGRIAVGVLLVQDVAVVMALTLFAGLAGGEGNGDVGAISMGVITAFVGMAGLAVAAAAAARWLLPWLFRHVSRSAETVFIWSLAWCFLFILAAELVHLSLELGAFIAGVSIAQLHFAEVLRRRVQPIVNFFLAVFFVTLGLRMDPVGALAEWPTVLALCGLVLVVKPAILLATIPRLGYGPHASFMTALTLAQMSEFSFILASMATAAGMLGERMLSVITLSGFITIAVSSFAILGADRVAAAAMRLRIPQRFGADARHDEPEEAHEEGHIIVVGMNTLGRRLVREFAGRGYDVVAIDTDPDKLEGLPARILHGSVDDAVVLEEAHFTDARLVASALQIEDTNNLLAYRCRLAGVPAAIHAFDTSLIHELNEIGVDHLIVSKHDGTREIAQRLRSAGIFDE